MKEKLSQLVAGDLIYVRWKPLAGPVEARLAKVAKLELRGDQVSYVFFDGIDQPYSASFLSGMPENSPVLNSLASLSGSSRAEYLAHLKGQMVPVEATGSRKRRAKTIPKSGPDLVVCEDGGV